MRGGNDPLWRSPTPFLSDRQSLKAQDCLRDLMVLLTEFCQNVADMHCGRIAQFQVAQRERINGSLDRNPARWTYRATDPDGGLQPRISSVGFHPSLHLFHCHVQIPVQNRRGVASPACEYWVTDQFAPEYSSGEFIATDYNGNGRCDGDPMIDWIRSYSKKRTKLRKLRVEHARSVAHRSALLRLGTSSNAALVLALQQIDLQIAAVEHDIRLMGRR